MITGNQGLVKQLNKWLVLNTIRQSERVSRADVARKTGLNSATVSNLTTELLADGLVQEWGSATSRLGRRPIMLGVNPSGLFAVGVELQSWGIRVVVSNLVAEIIIRHQVPLTGGTEPGAVVAAITAAVQQALSEGSFPPEKIAGVGVAVTGLVDQQAGVVLQSANLGWESVPLKAQLEERLGLPVFVERDSLAGAMSELWYGAGRTQRDLVFFLMEAGIGAGIVVDRQIQRGAHNGAGEVGHMTIDIHGPRCNCGNYGCLEVFASGIALERRMAAAARLSPGRVAGTEASHDLPAILAAAREGDPLAVQLLDEASRYLGLALANIINLYDPEVVILGGAIPLGSPALCDTMIASATRRALPLLTGKVRIALPHFGAEACAVGAATLVLERLFEPVQVVAVSK